VVEGARLAVFTRIWTIDLCADSALVPAQSDTKHSGTRQMAGAMTNDGDGEQLAIAAAAQTPSARPAKKAWRLR